ncbi:MAG: STAS domain-containing protein [Chroococcales cyanobacterium]
MISAAVCAKVATIEPSGYVSAANAEEFKNQLIAAVTAPEYTVLLVDMKELDFLDSAGLMALISGFRLAQSLDRQLALCSVPSSIRIMFELTQLDGVFEIYENRESFEAAMS